MSSSAERLLQIAMLAQYPSVDDIRPLQAALYRRLYAQGWRPSMHTTRAMRPPQRSDEQLLADFLAGDVEAFQALCDRHLRRLVGYARRHGPRSADAEDLVQETILVLYGRGREVLQHQEPNVAAFLFSTLRNKIRHALAKEARVQLEAAPEPDPMNTPDSLTAWVQRADFLQVLERTCDPLEQDIVLLALDGQQNTEIAEQLDLTANNVGVQKHRAIKKLRVAWQEAP